GYVLRRIIRRAIRHGYKQDLPNQFFHQLAEPLVDTIGGAYPQLAVASEQIIRALKKEEEQFSTTLQNGMNLLSNELKHVDMGTLPGDVVFKLYDTYGFPVDLTLDICQEHKVGIDEAGYEQLMSQQRAQSRAGERFQEKDLVLALEGTESIFEGYTQLEVSAEVNDIYLNEEGELKATPELTKGQRGALILNQTSFYGEAGGQVGDVGEIRSDDSTFVVTDTKLVNRLILHYGYVEEGIFGRSDKVLAKVDAVKRQDAARNHSATHLLHAALKKVLGGHVQQRGSLVEPDRLRFDFSHDLPLSNSEIEEIESLVNEKISQNSPVCTDVMPYDQAIDEGAVALFGEKYGDHVRVLEMGRGFSRELCGGTHVSSTAEIGLFRVISHSGVAAGTRRIEAVTGRQANLWTKDHENLLVKVNDSLQTNNDGLLDKVKGLLEERNKLERELRAQSARSAGDQAGILIQEAEQLGSVNLISGSVEGGSKSMMTVYDNIKSRIESGVVLLATVDKDKVNLVCGVTKDLVGVVKANDLMKKVAPIVGARGGGKPEMSRAGGGTTVTGINQFFDSAKSEIATLSQMAS
ncbi:MAG: alanine--tRNA ligase, partial [Gammaproteobacteria bacterium]|nr:alanine--tRNA ligase [Gammaproteobacteria bacterium]